jgi:flagellar assembly protein FliH
MAQIIATEDLPVVAGSSAVAFNIPDLKATAAKIIRAAKGVADQRINEANRQAAEKEKAAYAKGLEKGEAEGLKKGEAAGRAAGEKAARDEFTKSVASVAAALKASLAELNQRKTQLQADAETDLLHLALAIARRVARRELTVNPAAIMPSVQEAIGLCNNRSDVTLRLNPADVAAVENEIPALQGVFNDLGRVNVVGDDNIERGGVLLTNRQSTVNLQLAEQFAALARALTGGEHDPFNDASFSGASFSSEILSNENFSAASSPPANLAPSPAVEATSPPPANPSPEASPAPTNAAPSAAPTQAEATPPPQPSIETPASAAPTARPVPPNPLEQTFTDTPVNALPPKNSATMSLSGLKSLSDLTGDEKTEAAINAALRGE